MRVAQISEFGGLQALHLEEVAEPSPGPGEVLIKVTAVGLNFFDTLSLRNKYQVTPKLPYSPGAEVAGTIEAVGGGVTGINRGQRVDKDRGDLKPGETLAVLGAAGGAGLAAVEIGKLMGARVIAVASSEQKLELARKHGAEEGINYASEDLKARLKELTGEKGVD